MPAKPKPSSYYDVLTAAINDMVEHGYDSAERLEMWTRRLREAAERASMPLKNMEQALREMMMNVYRRLVEEGRIEDFHLSDEVNRFTLASVSPELRAELDRRILASANLIKLNRTEAINKTLSRFQGWATSIPKGGAAEPKKMKAKKDIRKSLVRLPFEERRVLIDQGHKLTSALNDIVAKGSGAIAAEWHSHWRQQGYNYRPDHKARDKKIYVIRDGWAFQNGLIKPDPKLGFTDDITKPAEEPFCRCTYRYIYNVSDMPATMITKKGKEELARVRAIINQRRMAA